jgi:hypothetical protein
MVVQSIAYVRRARRLRTSLKQGILGVGLANWTPAGFFRPDVQDPGAARAYSRHRSGAFVALPGDRALPCPVTGPWHWSAISEIC